MGIFTSNEPILNDAEDRLLSLGYEVVPEDKWALGFAIQKVESYIKNNCNLDEVPEGLHHVAVGMVCGEFLQGKQRSGQLAGFNFEPAVKSISEGDTSVSYAAEDTVSQKFDKLIERMAHPDIGEFARYRRVQW